MNPLVTVAVPTFKRLTLLREAVTSAMTQTYDRVEILIGDDGKSEQIRRWSQTVEKEDPRVRYQRNAQNLGLAGNWNALTAAAKGEFIIIIGDDDRLLPNCVATLVKCIQPDFAVAFSNHYLINNNGRRLKNESVTHTELYHRAKLPAGRVTDPEACVWRNSVPSSAALIRTSEVQRLRFQEDLNTPEIEFFLRLAQSGGQFAFTPEYLVEYRDHAESITAAGLRSDALASRLLQLSTRPEVEPFKRQFMEPLLVDAVSRSLALGNREQARQFLASEYYPKGARLRGIVQATCASLPTPLGKSVYRTMQRIKRAL